MHFPVESSSYRKKASQSLDYVPLLKPPRLYPSKMQTLQSNDSPALSATVLPPTTLTISTVTDPAIEAENAGMSPSVTDPAIEAENMGMSPSLTGAQVSPSLVQDANSHVKIVKKRGSLQGVKRGAHKKKEGASACFIETNNTALSLLQSLLEAAREAHSPLYKLCSVLASEMNWKTDFKLILGSFEKWIIDQRQNMFQFHQDSSGRGYIFYHPLENFPNVQDSNTMPRTDVSVQDSVIYVPDNRSIQDPGSIQNRNTKKRKLDNTTTIADTSANESKSLSPSTEDANDDTSFPKAGALLTLPPQLMTSPSVVPDAHSKAKLAVEAQCKKRGPQKGVKRGPYKKSEVPFTVELSSTALSLLQHLFGSVGDANTPLCNLSSLLAAKMNWKTDFHPALGSFENWLVNQRQNMFQFHKVAAGRSYVSYHPMEIFPYIANTTTMRRKGDLHETVVADQEYIQNHIPKKRKRQSITAVPTPDANTDSRTFFEQAALCSSTIGSNYYTSIFLLICYSGESLISN